ncbi:hypothetical protein AGMMS50276_10540 [Synergistales bacterium]|nr:hypothetical protein AGMMS50276_10540 [Synergistales bacterium]
MTAIDTYNVRPISTEVSKEVHDTREARKLKEACQQFESILWAQMMKKAKANARSMGSIDGEERKRPWAQMEDLSLEMACEDLAKSGGTGLWEVLYSSLVKGLESELKTKALAAERAEAASAYQKSTLREDYSVRAKDSLDAF